MKIKICGVTGVADALAVANEGADYVGLIFARSPRRVDLHTAKEILSRLPGSITPVGVFMDQPAEEVQGILKETGLRIAQLHGSESPDFAATLGVQVIKAFDSYTPETLGTLRKYDVFAYLLDVPKGTLTRTSIDAEWAQVAKKSGRIFVSGRLTPDSAADLVRKIRPFGVDACSATERSPGRKDHGKLRDFIQAVRAADRATAKIKVVPR